MTTPKRAAHFFRSRMATDVEEIWVAALNSDKKVLATQCLFRGTVDSCLFHPRDVFRFACLHNASAIVIAHNHPSGSHLPSDEDHLWTERLVAAAELMMIPLVDHLVITKRKHFSFLEDGKITGPV